MSAFFALAPWEYPGADFDPAPHAVVRTDVKGRGKVWWLKARDGIIHFRDASKVRVFAIPRRFPDLNPADTEQLTAIWQAEIARDNFGVHLIARRTWPGTLAASSFCIVLRADGSGTIREHFDTDWREFQPYFPAPLDLWQGQAFTGQIEQIVKAQRAHFLNRAVDPAHFQSLPAHWSGGDQNGNCNGDGSDAMIRVLRAAAQLLIYADPQTKFSGEPLTWNCKSNSPFHEGSVSGGLTFTGVYRFDTIWNLARWHFGFVGVEWKRASENPELRAQYGPRIWKAGLAKYGENWRGNWVGRPYETALSAPPLSAPSAHDKLEAALILRGFLRDKMPAAKVEALLQTALGN